MAFANTTIPTQSIFSGFSFAGIRRAFARGLRAAQIARMNEVMREMSVEQLREIGITRSEIADYAEMLIIHDVRS
jgi:uncharacterized protein YjiS (DUF1127 family)